MLAQCLGLPIAAVILAIYAASLLGSVLFTFFPAQFQKTEECLAFIIFPSVATGPLDIHVSSLDSWAKQHNKGFGSTLSMVALLNLISAIRMFLA